MSAFLQHPNVTALFESPATVPVDSQFAMLERQIVGCGRRRFIFAMPTLATFICDCGKRLNVMTDSDKGTTTIVPCPREGCQGRHTVRGEVLAAFIVQGGQSVRYIGSTQRDRSRRTKRSGSVSVSLSAPPAFSQLADVCSWDSVPCP